jgi:indolepyruvate ferredoxin oxidoreductase beta subunit
MGEIERTQPIAVLISAMGGEGGGVMSEWMVAAAQNAGLPVQGTSIPGVAQRTGATTYYVEIFPKTYKEIDERQPVFGLYPNPGGIDIMLVTELVEIARACQNGFVTPDRTLLIGSTRRFYAIPEKTAMGDGRLDAQRMLKAATTLPQRGILFDHEKLSGPRYSLNAIMLGVVAGSGKLPMIGDEHFRAAIKASGIAVEANLKGFDFGMKMAREGVPAEAAPAMAPPPAEVPALTVLKRDIAQRLPPQVHEIATLGGARLIEYQNAAYAHRYLDRLAALVAKDGGDYATSVETARHLAVWMAFEDVIRVAQVKSSAKRHADVRKEVQAKPDEPLYITEHFKPGIEEVSAMLPPALGRSLRAWGERTGRIGKWHLSMHIRSTTILGFLRLWLLGRLRWWRPHTFRFAEEQELIDAWMAAIVAAVPHNPRLAREIAGCARLLKGYSDTHRRGRQNFNAIFERIVRPALRLSGEEGAHAAQRLAVVREAALKDPEGEALKVELETGLGGRQARAA